MVTRRAEDGPDVRLRVLDGLPHPELPVRRAVTIASTLTVYTLIALPRIPVTLILAILRYGVELSIAPSIVPAIVLASPMSASIGMAMAHGIRAPVVTGLPTNLLMFVAMLFSPIAMPIRAIDGAVVGRVRMAADDDLHGGIHPVDHRREPAVERGRASLLVGPELPLPAWCSTTIVLTCCRRSSAAYYPSEPLGMTGRTGLGRRFTVEPRCR